MRLPNTICHGSVTAEHQPAAGTADTAGTAGTADTAGTAASAEPAAWLPVTMHAQPAAPIGRR